MTAIDPSVFSSHTGAEALWERVNTMAVTYYQFSVISSLYGRAFGVKTRDTGLEEAQGLLVNRCLRNAIYRELLSVQEELEQILNYNLTERYHYEEIPWQALDKWQSRWPGVEKLNVVRNWYSIPDGSFDLVMPLVEDADVVEGNVVHIPVDLVENPQRVAFWNENNQRLSPDFSSKRLYSVVDGNWEIPIATGIIPLTPSSTVSIYHQDYVVLVIDKFTDLPEGAVVNPVYPGTNQIIPTYRVDDLGSQLRYWFYAYTLVHPSFFGDMSIDWMGGEFFKFYRQVEFRYFLEEVRNPELVWISGNQETVYSDDPDDPDDTDFLGLTLSLGANGTFHVTLPTTLLKKLRDCQLPGDPESAVLRVWYKTNPEKLDQQYRSQIESARHALARKAASQLPLKDCGCGQPDGKELIGYIAENQVGYYTQYQNAVSGTEVIRYEYGRLHGQQRFAEFIAGASTYPRIFRM